MPLNDTFHWVEIKIIQCVLEDSLLMYTVFYTHVANLTMLFVLVLNYKSKTTMF